MQVLAKRLRIEKNDNPYNEYLTDIKAYFKQNMEKIILILDDADLDEYAVHKILQLLKEDISSKNLKILLFGNPVYMKK